MHNLSNLNRHVRRSALLVLLLVLALLTAALPAAPAAAADMPSFRTQARITDYKEGKETVSFTLSYTNLNPGVIWSFGVPAAVTDLQFSPGDACTDSGLGLIVCTPGTTQFTMSYTQVADVTATQNGFVHPIEWSSSIPMDWRYELTYPASFAVDSTTITPDSNTNSMLTWTASAVTSKTGSVTFNTTCLSTLDVMLVLDGSGSIYANDFKKMKEFAQALVAGFDVGADTTHFGIVQFGYQGWGRLESPLSGDAAALATKINSIRQLDGGTDMEEGLQRARDELAAHGRAGVPRAVILFADGDHNQPGNPYTVARALKDQDNTAIFAVAIGSTLNIQNMNAIASDPDSNYVYRVNTFAGLSSVLQSLTREVCKSRDGGGGGGGDPAPEPLALTGVEPNSGPNDAPTDVLISGTGFATSGTVQARLSSGAGSYDLTSVTVTAATSMSAQVPAGLPLGSYDLTVTNPDGEQKTLARAFSIVIGTPQIDAVLPAWGYNDEEVEIVVRGANFADGAVVALGDTALATTWQNSGTLVATVPTGLTPGSYAVRVTNPNGRQASLADAFSVLDSTKNNDLLGYGTDIWVQPGAPQAGQNVELGLLVQRLGGKVVLENVKVRFVRDSLTGAVLGESSVPFLDPAQDKASTRPLTVKFDKAETFTLYAIIDPANDVVEDLERNNVISRTLTVQPAGADITPPLVQAITVNSQRGADITVSQATIGVSASDPAPNPSGLGMVSLVEYIFSQSANDWIPIAQSNWMDYGATPGEYAWTMLETTGMHYLQVRVRDRAGNISVGDAQQWANFVPPTDRVKRRQIKVYRYEVAAGQQLQVDLELLSGDADLYVWSSRSDQSARVSNQDASANEQVIVPASEVVPGVYQIEVYGFTNAEFRLRTKITTASTSSLSSATVAGVSPTKQLPSAPLLPVSSVPDARQGGVAAPPADTYAVYLPLVVR